ncbi:hypothetical protein H2200_012758 [Cladophialophora chaetospira]|uniref:PLL-like beta propeller domain-containing protein n=1 Tax=Cladophialophora chaetospira TaxID=386627 RepID=A0AA38WXJ5_9EURO|nr:hypothetical protein H2200_012758 [Cladophialophora chaetospira]
MAEAPGLILSPYSDLEAVTTDPKLVGSHYQEKDNSSHVSEKSLPFEPGVTIWRWSKKRTAVVALVAFVSIGAVIGGALGGTLPQKSTAADESLAAPDVSPNGTQNSTSTFTPAGITSTRPATMTGFATPVTNLPHPTAISWGFPHLEVIAVNGNRSVGWKYKTSEENWIPQASDSLNAVEAAIAPWENSVSVVADSGAQIVHMFAAAAVDGYFALFHKCHGPNMTWQPENDWEAIQSAVNSSAALVSWGENGTWIFALNDGRRLFYTKYSSTITWNSWISLGGFWETYTPTVISWEVGRFDVFVVNPTSFAIYWKYFDGGVWTPGTEDWESLDGYATSQPVAVSMVAGTIDLFVRGGDAGLWHCSYSDSKWSSWTSISGTMTIQGDPDVVSWGDGRLDVYASGMDGSLLHRAYSNGIWAPSEGFEVLGKDLAGPPKVVSDGIGSLHVVAVDRDQNLVHRAWSESAKAWRPEIGYEYLGNLA